MALNEKNTPVGLDLEMHKIQTLVYTYLTTNSCVKGDYSNYESYNRVYKNETKDGVVAETFLTGNDYKDVFLNDNVGVSSFFIANDDEDHITPTRKQRTISLIFQINLSKVYPNIPHRADEEFHNEVSNALAGLKKPSIKLGAKVGINNVYSEFEVQKLKDKFHDMQPYHVFRQDFEVQYDYDCCPVFATSGPTCDIAPITVSTESPTSFGGSDGTATANVTGTVNGTLSYLWDAAAGNQTIQTATGLIAGNYTVEVFDSIPDGCSGEGTGTVEQGAQSELTDFPESIIIWDARINANFNGGSVGNNQPISSIASVSPATVTGVETNSEKQPIYFSSGFGSENTAYWRHTSNHIIETTYDRTGAFTVVCALDFILIDNVSRYIFSGASLATGMHLKVKNNSLIFFVEGVDTIGPSVSTGGVIVKCIIDGANSKFGINQDPYTSVDTTGSSITDLSFGGKTGAFVIGSLNAEVGIFGGIEKALTTTELDAMVGTYASQFGITL